MTGEEGTPTQPARPAERTVLDETRPSHLSQHTEPGLCSKHTVNDCPDPGLHGCPAWVPDTSSPAFLLELGSSPYTLALHRGQEGMQTTPLGGCTALPQSPLRHSKPGVPKEGPCFPVNTSSMLTVETVSQSVLWPARCEGN